MEEDLQRIFPIEFEELRAHSRALSSKTNVERIRYDLMILFFPPIFARTHLSGTAENDLKYALLNHASLQDWPRKSGQFPRVIDAHFQAIGPPFRTGAYRLVRTHSH